MSVLRVNGVPASYARAPMSVKAALLTIILIYIYHPDTMYVCLCNAVTDCEIRAAVEDGAASLTDVQSTLGVAVCCGRCSDTARDIVDEHLRTRASRGRP